MLLQGKDRDLKGADYSLCWRMSHYLWPMLGTERTRLEVSGMGHCCIPGSGGGVAAD